MALQVVSAGGEGLPGGRSSAAASAHISTRPAESEDVVANRSPRLEDRLVSAHAPPTKQARAAAVYQPCPGPRRNAIKHAGVVFTQAQCNLCFSTGLILLPRPGSTGNLCSWFPTRQPTAHGTLSHSNSPAQSVHSQEGDKPDFFVTHFSHCL